MKVFIAGATGVLGTRVVKLLVNNGHLVVGLARSKEKENQLKEIGADAIQVDLFDKKQLIKATQSCNAILHLATSIPQKTMPKLKDWHLNDRIRIEGTRNLVSAAQHNNISRFIGQSITAIYGQQNGHFVDDRTPIPSEPIKMLESAIEMESIIMNSLKNDYLIFRFSTFYSSDAFHTQDLLRNIKKGKLPLIGNGEFFWNFIHTDDAAASIVYGLENYENLQGKILNVSDYMPITYYDFLSNAKGLLKGKKPLKLPHWLVKLVLGNEVYRFLTNSYRLKKPQELKGLTFDRMNFLEEIKSMNIK